MTTTTIIQTLAGLCVVLAAAAALIYLGWRLAIRDLRQERLNVGRHRAELDAEWRALDNTRLVREVFMTARRVMQDEAQRHYRGDTGPKATR